MSIYQVHASAIHHNRAVWLDVQFRKISSLDENIFGFLYAILLSPTSYHQVPELFLNKFSKESRQLHILAY